MPQRNLNGWVRQPHDPRDRVYQAPRRLLAALPSTVDLSAGMGRQLDQEALGSCGPFTAAELIMFDQKVEGLPVAEPSELFVYYNCRVLMGTVGQDSGVDNRSLLKSLAQAGFCPAAAWPYAPSKFAQQPPAAAYQAALANRTIDYAAVQQAPDQMKGTLAAGRPFMFGFEVFAQIMSDAAAATGVLTSPGSTETPVGGHDVSFVGFNDTGHDLPGVRAGNRWPANYYKFRNHWMNAPGAPWGDGGWGYIPAPYAHGPNASDFWVISTVPGGVPTPPTPPQPTPTPTPPPPTPPSPDPLPARAFTGAWVGPTGDQVNFRVDFLDGLKSTVLVSGTATRRH